MASQHVFLPQTILETFFDCRGELAIKLGSIGIEVEIRSGRASALSFIFCVDCDAFDMATRPASGSWVFALALVPEGEVPTHWPAPLPDAAVLHLLDTIEPILCECHGLSGHDCLRIAEAFAAARNADGIGPRPIQPKPLRSSRQRRLRCAGLQLSRLHETAIAPLERSLALYQARLAASGLERVVATVSCSAELGMKLRLRPGGVGQPVVAGLLADSRRGSLQSAMASAAALADAAEFVHECFAPCAVDFRDGIDVAALVGLNGHVLGAACHVERTPLWRSRDDQALGDGGRVEVPDQVPAAAVPSATYRFIEACDPGYWHGVHPLVHAVMAHLEFLRIRPFERANGRTARLLLQIMLQRRDWPVLPWEWACERLYDDYQHAVRVSLLQGCYEPLLQLVIRAWALSVRLGERMIDVLEPQRATLAKAFKRQGFSPAAAGSHAEGLLRGVLIEGTPRWAGTGSSRPALRQMAEIGLIDIIRTPIGAVFSVPAVRSLFAPQQP